MEKQPRVHGPGIIKNATTKIIGQQRADLSVLANHLYLNEVVLREIKGLVSPRKGRSAEALLALGEKAERTHIDGTIRETLNSIGSVVTAIQNLHQQIVSFRQARVNPHSQT